MLSVVLWVVFSEVCVVDAVVSVLVTVVSVDN